jgi:hypothetical protein
MSRIKSARNLHNNIILIQIYLNTSTPHTYIAYLYLSMEASEGMITVCAGAVSGMLADVLTHPLSTVKTRLQVRESTA